MNWFRQSVDDVLRELESGRDGVSDQQAATRREKYGPNAIQQGKKVSPWKVLVHQFTSPLIYVLLGALVVTLAIRSYSDAIVIGAVLVINATIGFIQEYNAESAVQSLMEMITPKATVVRDGKEREIDSRQLVPGDVVRMSQGKMVPADVRLMEVQSLQLNEAALTGESVPVSKSAEALEDAEENLPTADQKNMAFMGTAVTTGNARAVVVDTGPRTRLGEIARQVQEAGQIETPLERRIRHLARWITVGILGVAALAMLIGWLMGQELFELFLLGVALVVAAIPEGLPIVVTVALALGVRRMAKRHALIRNLPAVDTLGSTTLILSDKTGTLTQNQMTVRGLYAGQRFDLSGGGQTLAGELRREDEPAEVEAGSALWFTLLTGLLCNEARISPREQKEAEGGDEKARDTLDTSGDPMEVALLVSAAKAGLDRNDLQDRYPRQDSIPFKTERRFMATVHKDQDGKGPLVLIKGAPEKIFAMCDRSLDADGEETGFDREQLQNEAEALAGEGLRVLGMAIGRGSEAAEAIKSDEPQGFTFVGMQGMLDPPRPSVIEAVDRCHQAGIRVAMVTGDHARTAAALAVKTHLNRSVWRRPGGAPDQQPENNAGQQGDELPEVITGQQVGEMEDAELDEVVSRVNVYARVEPSQKLRLVNHLKQQGEIVAVTGDGVNDAPALKNAHLGAAMGSGTDVAKEASDMVITDDNFASVYAAVEEGRTAFRNIRMATFFLLSTGAAYIIIILASLFFRWPLPMLPAQILWSNVVTNGIADVALAFEPGEKALYNRPPRPPQEGVLDRTLLERLVLVGFWLATGTLAVFWWKSGGGDGDMTEARTAALTTLVLFQKVHVFNCRSEDVSIFHKSLLLNKVLFIGVSASLAVHIGAMYLPLTQDLLSLTPLDATTWGVSIAVALTAIIVNELHKRLRPSAGARQVTEGGEQ
ncbi:MAG: HAD-IC family P-type ATPase [Thiogranum sp.]|nr:HAD-IC family P-type ATPase [Thiogranum sp.]